MPDTSSPAETAPQSPAARRAVLESRLGAVFGGRYRLTRLLGTGGMSAVYEAVQAPLDRVVALKLTKGSDSPEMRALFEREAATIARLRHPCNVTLYDFGVLDDGELFLVMERLEGSTLAQALARADGGRLGAARVMGIARQICAGLAEAHGLGIVHRDLKPTNVVLDRIGAEERARVIDYGVALTVAQGAEASEQAPGAGLFGTPVYMAPEQIAGHAIGPRADIYALGVMLYELLAGAPPFDGEATARVLLDHVQTAPPPLEVPGVPPGLAALVMQMLAKDPTERPADVAEVRARLEALSGQRAGAESAPPSPSARPDAVREARAELDALRVAGASVTAVQQALDQLLRVKRAERAGARLHPGVTLGGRFTLGSELGRGGFGTVWAGWDELTDERVAIKVLHHQWSDDRTRRDRFFRGARQMTRLEHPGVVRIREPRAEDGHWYYFVLDYVAGGDLAQAVRAGSIGGTDAVVLLAPVADALSAAHRLGVIHRDVKPSNILLDGQGRSLLTDFDLVRAIDTTGGTRTGALGTFLYAAPEVLESGKDAGPAADQYGLAMTLVFAVHGGDLPSWTLRRPERLIRSLPCGPALQRVLRRGLAFNAAERFPSIAEFFAAAVDAVQADATPEQGSVSPGASLGDGPAAAAPGSEHRPPLMQVPAGTFVMGSPEDEPERFGHEGPAHEVFVSRSLLMSATPITLGQYVRLMGSSPVRSKDLDGPVRKITWFDALRFCNALSAAEGLTPACVIDGEVAELSPGADGYRLPTEAEWEHACRAGTRTRFSSGDDESDLERVGWYSKNSRGRLQHPGQKPPNRWGLRDMHGNVFEWCWDRMGPYPAAAVVDPFGPLEGRDRVIRGGSCFNDATFARSAYRIWRAPDARFPSLGFRVVRPAPG